MRAGDVIPEAVLDRVVSGINLSPGRLRDQLDDSPTLLVFLRHFGCMFCREALAELRAASEREDGFPRTLLFFQGTPTEGRAFMRRDWPGMRAVADPEGEMYDAFGVERGGVLQNLGPPVWRARRRALAAGYANGPRQGDIWRLPGVILTRGDRVEWVQPIRHAAELPDFEGIATCVARLDSDGARVGE